MIAINFPAEIHSVKTGDSTEAESPGGTEKASDPPADGAGDSREEKHQDHYGHVRL